MYAPTGICTSICLSFPSVLAQTHHSTRSAHRVGALLRELDRLRVEEGVHLRRQLHARAFVACKQCAPSVHMHIGDQCCYTPVSRLSTAHAASFVTQRIIARREPLARCTATAAHAPRL